MISLRHTALGLALSLAFAGQALAVTTIPFWHSMEGELGKEVDSLAQRFNAANPDYKIVPVYKGNYEQSLSGRHRRLPYRQRAGYSAGLRSRHRDDDGLEGD